MPASLTLLFAAVYLLLCNWFHIKSFLIALRHPKRRIHFIRDPWITQTLLRKTGVTIDQITIFETPKLFAMMPSTPPFETKMIISRGMYESFNENELEWVILHEAGHYVMWHVVKLAMVQLVLLVIGVYALIVSQSILIGAGLLAVLVFLYIQFSKHLEYAADKYSIARVDNPQGVITAQKKLINSHHINEKSLMTILLRSGTLPSQRIALCKRLLSQRERK